MDNLIAEGKARPFIIVMANSYVPGSSDNFGGRAAGTNQPGAAATDAARLAASPVPVDEASTSALSSGCSSTT